MFDFAYCESVKCLINNMSQRIEKFLIVIPPCTHGVGVRSLLSSATVWVPPIAMGAQPIGKDMGGLVLWVFFATPSTRKNKSASGSVDCCKKLTSSTVSASAG